MEKRYVATILYVAENEKSEVEKEKIITADNDDEALQKAKSYISSRIGNYTNVSTFHDDDFRKILSARLVRLICETKKEVTIK